MSVRDTPEAVFTTAKERLPAVKVTGHIANIFIHLIFQDLTPQLVIH
jgi:hypothetical protein